MTLRELVPASRKPRPVGPYGLAPSARRLREAALVLVPAAVVVLLGYRQRWVGDDGMIYTRTVRQILAGHGPVFNVGERAEASTGTLWQWLVAACTWLSGRDPSVVAVALGIVLTGAGYALAMSAARRAVRPLTDAPLLPLGMLVLLPVKACWDYASSGLENGLSTGWIGLAWWSLVRARAADGGGYGTATTVTGAATGTVTGAAAGPAGGSARCRYGAAAVIGLGPLVRPDLGLVSAVFLVALWRVTRPRPRSALLTLCVAGALPAAYEVFRAGYYGVLMPLPGLTKEASQSVWERGFAYFANFSDPYRLWLPLMLLAALAAYQLVPSDPATGRAGAGVGALPRRRYRPPAELLAPPVAGLLSWLYVCRVGGDFMHGRLLLPGLFLLMLPLCAVPLSRPAAAVGGALLVWALCCALLWRPPGSSGNPYSILDEQQTYVTYTGDPHPITEAVHGDRPRPFRPAVLAAMRSGAGPELLITPPGSETFVALPMSDRFRTRLAGAWGLLGNNGIVMPLDGTSVDTLGLAYPLAAHQQRAAARTAGRSGHEKPVDAAWIIADYTDPGVALPAGIDPARVAAARHALTCGPLAELQKSVRAPLTAARFWRNLRDSVQRTRFRYPADPITAEATLCRH